MVRPACDDRDIQPVRVRVGDGLLPLDADLCIIVRQRLIRGWDAAATCFFFSQVFPQKYLTACWTKRLGSVSSKYGIIKSKVLQRAHVGPGAARDNRPQPDSCSSWWRGLVDVIGHAGIEDQRPHPLSSRFSICPCISLAG